MENRFGFKDFILTLLLVVLVISVFLSIKATDRQSLVLQKIQEQSADQTKELARISRALGDPSRWAGPRPQGAAPPPASLQQPPSATRPAAASTAGGADVLNDPFARVRAAQKMPGYAPGDRFIDATPGLAKITPLVSGDIYSYDIQARVLESLAVRHPVTLKFVPLLAKSWAVSPDGLTVRFVMREDVAFSDGERLTADDVVFSFKWVMNPAVDAPRQRAYYQKIAGVEKVNDYEVVFTFKEPYFKSFELAAGMNILPRHFYEKFTPEEYNKRPGLLLGSGPYRCEDPTGWAPGKQLFLLRNERYWGEPAPFDRLVYKEFAADLAKITDFRNGDIDALTTLTPDQYANLLQDAALVKRTQHYEYESPTAGYRYIAWNQKRAGKATRFADKRVRQAMTMLTDRQRVCDEIFLGQATPVSGPFIGKSKQADPAVNPWPYDPAKAIALLKDAGFEDRKKSGVVESADGGPFKFQLTYPSGNPSYEKMVLFLKDSYARAGIILEPNPQDWSVFQQRIKQRDFDAIALGWSSNLEGDLYQAFHSDQMKEGGDDFVSYVNPDLDKLITEARTTVDESKRMPLWNACHRLLHEDQPYTFMFSRKTLVFLDGRIKNVQKMPLGLNDLIEWYVPQADWKPQQ